MNKIFSLKGIEGFWSHNKKRKREDIMVIKSIDNSVRALTVSHTISAMQLELMGSFAGH